MRQEHRIGISVPHLFRAHIDILFVRINVNEKLRRIKDLVDRVDRMLSPYDREKCDRIEDEQERTCDLEKVAHHEVCRPCSLKF